jgi:hypothetical protein
MDSKMQTGLLLVLGPIVAMVGWMVLYPSDGSYATAQELMAEPELSKAAVILGFSGMIATFIGLINISRKMLMAGGAGSSYANIATFMFMAVVPLMFLGAAVELAVADATKTMTASTVMMFGTAVGSGMAIPMGVGVFLLGIGIALAKNFHVGAAVLLMISGAALAISSPSLILGTDNLAEMVGFMGLFLTSIVLGVLRLRAD